MPFDAAFEADDGLCYAWIIANGEINGRSFDWNTKGWIDPR